MRVELGAAEILALMRAGLLSQDCAADAGHWRGFNVLNSRARSRRHTRVGDRGRTWIAGGGHGLASGHSHAAPAPAKSARMTGLARASVTRIGGDSISYSRARSRRHTRVGDRGRKGLTHVANALRRPVGDPHTHSGEASKHMPSRATPVRMTRYEPAYQAMASRISTRVVVNGANRRRSVRCRLSCHTGCRHHACSPSSILSVNSS